MLPAIVLATALASAAFTGWLGLDLPPRVASHFGPDGTADGFTPRALFVGFGIVVTSVLPAAVWWLQRRAARRGTAKIPHADRWFAVPRRAATQTFLDRHAAVFSVALTAFLCVVWALVTSANRKEAAASLDMATFGVALAAFVAFTIGWVIALRRRFSKGIQ